MNQKWIVIVLIILVVILAGTTTYLAVTRNRPVAQQQTPTNNEVQQSTESKDDSLLYVDKEAGYQIKLPANWTGYRVVNGAFQLPTTNTEWYEQDSNGQKTYSFGTVFNILTYSVADWDKLKNECGSVGSQTWHPGCVTDDSAIGRSETKVYTVAWPNSGPSVGGDANWGTLAREVNFQYLKDNFSTTMQISESKKCYASYEEIKPAWYEDLLKTELAGASKTFSNSACNNGSGQIVYMTNTPIDNYVYDQNKKVYGSAEIKMYNLTSKKSESIYKRDLGFYEGCGINKWEGEVLNFQCGAGDGGLSTSVKYSFNLKNKQAELLERCNTEAGRTPETICE